MSKIYIRNDNLFCAFLPPELGQNPPHLQSCLFVLRLSHILVSPGSLATCKESLKNREVWPTAKFKSPIPPLGSICNMGKIATGREMSNLMRFQTIKSKQVRKNIFQDSFTSARVFGEIWRRYRWLSITVTGVIEKNEAGSWICSSWSAFNCYSSYCSPCWLFFVIGWFAKGPPTGPWWHCPPVR